MATSSGNAKKKKKTSYTPRSTNRKSTKKRKSSTQKAYPKTNQRSRTKYPALNPQFNLRSRTELLDYDYLSKLTDKELKYLNKFTEEFVNASVDVKKPWRNLHKSKKSMRECFNRNNARNRDVLTQQKAMGKHIYLDDIQDVGNLNNIESLEDRMDMQFLNIIDELGNLLIDDSQIVESSDHRSSNRRNSRKKGK